MHILNTTTIRP